MTDFISVVIPIYNQSEYLHECLMSVLSQSIANWEVIVVDDCSNDDDALAITRSFHDQRIEYIKQDQNRGLAATRNRGIRLARSELILPLDADDKLAPDCLQKLSDFLNDNPRYDCVFTDFHLFGIQEGIVRYKVRDTLSLLKQQWIPGSGILLRKSLWEKVGGYCEADQLRAGNEDWDFYLGAEEIGFKAGHIQDPLYFYRKHKESMVTRLMYFDYQTRIFMYYRHQQLIDNFDFGYRFIADGYINSIIASIKHGEFRRAAKLVNQARSFPLKDQEASTKVITEIISLSSFRIYQKIYRFFRNLIRKAYSNVFRWIYQLEIGRKVYWNYKAKDIDNTWGESRHDFEVLKTIFNSIKPVRVLDIGCGTGRLFPLYKSLETKEIFGQDISTYALDIAKERYPDSNIHLINSRMTELQFPDNYFDIAISNRVLQHFPENLIEKNIESICKLCKYVYVNEISEIKELRSTYCYLHDYLRLFKKNGFSEIETGSINEQKWSLFGKSSGYE